MFYTSSVLPDANKVSTLKYIRDFLKKIMSKNYLKYVPDLEADAF
jgi:hypothetical protein